MVYLFLFFALLGGVVAFDFSKVKRRPYRAYYYFFLLFYFILMSGLSFKVGSDTNAYMAEFSAIGFDSLEGASLLAFANKQPVWLLFESVCKFVFKDFFFMKFIISCFVCISIFKFFRRRTRHLFSVLLAYFVMMSFDVNFNILRQSISIAFFLMAYNYLARNKLLAAYLLIVLAVLFHNSAIILLIIPLVLRLHIRKCPVVYLSATIGVSLLLVFFSSYSGLIQALSLIIRSDDFYNIAAIYDDAEYGSSSVRVISVLVYVILLSLIFFYLIKRRAPNSFIWMFLFYSMLLITSYGIPILGRIKLYFVPFYIVAIVDVIYSVVARFKPVRARLILTLTLLLLFISPSIRYFFIRNPRYNDLQLVQYYPYHSVIDKVTEPKREMLFPANY